MQSVVPDLVSKISKVIICRDPLTSTSRGICYLSFENLVDSMNLHNALRALDPPLVIDDREILVTYCVDSENRHIVNSGNGHGSGRQHSNYGSKSASGHQYTLADVPRLAEYSAGVYAQNPTEHDYYYKYYTDFYVEQINNGEFSNLPTMSQMGGTANSGAAVALSAMQRKQQKQPQFKTASAYAGQPPLQVPNGDGTKKYRKFTFAKLLGESEKVQISSCFLVATPDPTQYQYDESSGFYYDPTTGLYYDANSQYYYNSEIASYMYWDAESSSYILATQTQPDSTSTTVNEVKTAAVTTAPKTNTMIEAPAPEPTKPPKEEKHDKVKVAKKIVKDMEKWAKQLNQKKDQSGYYATAVQPPLAKSVVDDVPSMPQAKQQPLQPLSSGYADVGFAILESRNAKKEVVAHFGSDSDTEVSEQRPTNFEQDLVNFEQLTCLLCKRAFQSLDILNKHLKLSNLHKENLQKYTASAAAAAAKDNDKNNGSDSGINSLSYRDRAKERRQKYVEGDPPPANKIRERFEKELKKHSSQLQKKASEQLASLPIGQSNLGNRMLQKMGWSEGQGLGRANQGRTNIIEVSAKRSQTFSRNQLNTNWFENVISGRKASARRRFGFGVSNICARWRL